MIYWSEDGTKKSLVFGRAAYLIERICSKWPLQVTFKVQGIPMDCNVYGYYFSLYLQSSESKSESKFEAERQKLNTGTKIIIIILVEDSY